MMAAGGVEALPAHDQRGLHRALSALNSGDDLSAERLWAGFGGRLRSSVDPAVGRRVEGVTTAIWEAVNRGLLTAVEYGDGTAAYELQHDAAARSRRQLMRLPPQEVAAVHRAAAAWDSTRLKNAVRPALSS